MDNNDKVYVDPNGTDQWASNDPPLAMRIANLTLGQPIESQSITPLLAEVIAKNITDLVEQQVTQARRDQTAKDAAIVERWRIEFESGSRAGSYTLNDLLNTIKQEIADGHDV